MIQNLNPISALNCLHILIDFRSTLGRIFSNKLILSNIAAIACVYTVLINMLYEEPNYMESVFFVPKHTTDATDQNTIIIGL